MKTAYKMFNADLTCTHGRGTFQYEPGKWYETDEANCARNGFHCALNPLDCMNYYPRWDTSQCWLVAVDGDIDEDGTDTKISATKIRLIRRLDLKEFVTHALSYIVTHPHLDTNYRVKREYAVADETDKFIIVRGKDPVAAGTSIGQYIALLQEEPITDTIAEAGMFYVDGEEIKTEVFYDVEGRSRRC